MKKTTHTTIAKMRKEIQRISRIDGIDELNVTVYVTDEDDILTSDLQVEITTVEGELETIHIETYEDDPDKHDYWEFVEAGLTRHKTTLKKVLKELETYNIDVDKVYTYNC